MIKMIVAQESFDRLKEYIGEEVEVISFCKGHLNIDYGYLFNVIDFQGIELGGCFIGYVPFISIQKTGILSIRLKNSEKALFTNESIRLLDTSISDDEWYEAALSRLYGSGYIEQLKKKHAKNGSTPKQELKEKIYSKKEIEKKDEDELLKSIEIAKEKYSSEIYIPISIKNKLITAGALLIDDNKIAEWKNFVEKMFTCGEFVLTIKVIIELLSALEDAKDVEDVLDNIKEKYDFLSTELYYLVINASIYFSPYKEEIRKLVSFRNEKVDGDTNNKCKR